MDNNNSALADAWTVLSACVFISRLGCDPPLWSLFLCCHISRAQYARKGIIFPACLRCMNVFWNQFLVQKGAQWWQKFRRCCTQSWMSEAWEASFCLAAKGSVERGPPPLVKAVWPWNPPCWALRWWSTADASTQRWPSHCRMGRIQCCLSNEAILG